MQLSVYTSCGQITCYSLAMKHRKGKRRAMTGYKIAEEKERDASRQLRRDKKAAAALEAQEEKRREQEKLERLVGLLIHSYNSASIVLG
jgi:hypothetical protein